MSNLLYPVHVYEDGMELPKEGTYFVVAGNGTWLHKDTGIVRCFVPVENISFLDDLKVDVDLECKLAKIPARLVWRIKEFFRRIVASHHAESEITLYYNKETADYKIHVPKQIVSHGSVNYERLSLSHIEGMENYLRVGTIHSHCDFGAFHSGTDEGDEEDFDGLHVTFGHNDKDEFTISASIVVNGFRKKVDPLTVLEGIEFVSDPEYYRLSSIDETARTEWAEGLEKWEAQVNSRSSQWACEKWLKANVKDIEESDVVEWVGDHESIGLKVALGEGPFRVQSVDESGDKIVIKTNAGFVRLSSKLFKKVTQ